VSERRLFLKTLVFGAGAVAWRKYFDLFVPDPLWEISGPVARANGVNILLMSQHQHEKFAWLLWDTPSTPNFSGIIAEFRDPQGETVRILRIKDLTVGDTRRTL
jgi:hypothetical protein